MIVATSGGYDPLHVGHIECLEKSKSIAGNDKLIVIVNTDEFLMRKKGFAFMPLKERLIIVASIKYVDEVIVCIDDDQTVCKTLRMLKETHNIEAFTKGGDRSAAEIPEAAICRELNIQIIDGLGEKIQSSSDLVKKSKA
jgi:D-beta-D-heptose 7-phosphate kinase/D-beta-D-heptose 1-phosphate adenosyltransferase